MQPYEGHDAAVTLLLLPAGFVVAPWLVVRGVQGRGRGGVWAGARLLWGGAVAMYTWGLLHLLFFDDQDMSRACDAAVGEGQLTGYDASFVPLSFGCRTADGATVLVHIPAYVNVVTAVCLVCAVVLTVCARVEGLCGGGPGVDAAARAESPEDRGQERVWTRTRR